MTAKEILENIKKALFEETPAAPAAEPAAPAEPMIYKLSDGSEIKVSALEVGGDVMIADAPAPAGTYVLEDLSSIVVGEDSKIAEMVAAPAAEPAPELPEDMSAKFEERIVKLERESQEFAAAYNETTAGYKSAFEAFETKIAGQNEIIGQLVQLCEQLTALPSADLPETRKVSSFSKVETAKGKLGKYAEAAQKIAEKHNS